MKNNVERAEEEKDTKFQTCVLAQGQAMVGPNQSGCGGKGVDLGGREDQTG